MYFQLFRHALIAFRQSYRRLNRGSDVQSNISSTYNSSVSRAFEILTLFFRAPVSSAWSESRRRQEGDKGRREKFNGIRSRVADTRRRACWKERGKTTDHGRRIISEIFFRRGFQFAGIRATHARLGEGEFLIKNITFSPYVYALAYTCYTYTHTSRRSRRGSQNLPYPRIRRKHAARPKNTPTSRS